MKSPGERERKKSPSKDMANLIDEISAIISSSVSSAIPSILVLSATALLGSRAGMWVEFWTRGGGG